MNKEQEIKIMKERAAKLAEPIIEHDSSQDVEYVLFTLGDVNEYGIASNSVEEIIKPELVTWVPCVPNAIAGLVNWRGNLLTVINASVLLAAKPQALQSRSWIIVLHHEGRRLGLAVATVISNKTFSVLDLQPSLQLHSGQKSAYIQGTLGEKIAILNVESFFSSKDLLF